MTISRPVAKLPDGMHIEAVYALPVEEWTEYVVGEQAAGADTYPQEALISDEGFSIEAGEDVGLLLIARIDADGGSIGNLDVEYSRQGLKYRHTLNYAITSAPPEVGC